MSFIQLRSNALQSEECVRFEPFQYSRCSHRFLGGRRCGQQDRDHRRPEHRSDEKKHGEPRTDERMLHDEFCGALKRASKNRRKFGVQLSLKPN